MQESSGFFVPLAIAIIMLGIGFNVTIKSFRHVFTKPRAILTGLSLQLILLPVIGFFIAFSWDMLPVYKVGLLIIAASPGGTASNLLTHMLKGRVALSISLTSFNSFLILFTIPLVVNFGTTFFMGVHHKIELSFWNTFQNLATTVVAPVAIGMIIRHFLPKLIEKVKKPLNYVLPGLLIAIFIYVWFNSPDRLTFDSWENYSLLIPSFLLNIASILLGYYLPGLLKIDHRGKYTIGIEMGLKNSALAIFITEQIIGNYSMALMAVLYSSFSFFSTWGLAYLLKLRLFRNDKILEK